MGLKINGEYLPDILIEDEYARVRKNYQYYSNVPLPSRETLLTLVKENLTRRVVLRQEALKSKIHIPQDILNKKIAFFKKQLRTQPPPPTSSYSQNIIPAEKQKTWIEQHVLLQLKIDKMLAEVANQIAEPTEKQLSLFYQDNEKIYQNEMAVFLFHITTDCQDVEKLQDLKQSFETIAINFRRQKEKFFHANLETLGWRIKSQIQPNFQNTLFDHSLPKIYYTTPIQHSHDVLHLFCVKERQYLAKIPFKNIKLCIKAELVHELQQRKVDMFVYKLMQNSEIVDEALF